VEGAQPWADGTQTLPLQTLETAASSMRQGLAAMHAMGVGHGDVSAHNIMVTPSGTTYWIDLGEAEEMGVGHRSLHAEQQQLEGLLRETLGHVPKLLGNRESAGGGGSASGSVLNPVGMDKEPAFATLLHDVEAKEDGVDDVFASGGAMAGYGAVEAWVPPDVKHGCPRRETWVPPDHSSSVGAPRDEDAATGYEAGSCDGYGSGGGWPMSQHDRDVRASSLRKRCMGSVGFRRGRTWVGKLSSTSRAPRGMAKASLRMI